MSRFPCVMLVASLFALLFNSCNAHSYDITCEQNSDNPEIRSKADIPTTWAHASHARDNCVACDWVGVKMAVVYSYHNQCNTMRFNVESFKKLPPDIKRQTRLLFVDDGSQVPAAACVPEPVDGMKIVLVHKSIPWNTMGARNLGAFVSCTKWLMMLDMDAFLSTWLIQTAFGLIKQPHSKNKLYHLNRYITEVDALDEKTVIGTKQSFHPAMMMISREMYWKQEGCDEDFTGRYGGTHLKWHFNQRSGGKVLDDPSLIMCNVVSPLDDQISHTVVPIDKTRERNHVLFHAKDSGKMAWNRTILRFEWHELKDSDYPMALKPEWPEANKIVEQSLKVPVEEAAYARKFWFEPEELANASDTYCF